MRMTCQCSSDEGSDMRVVLPALEVKPEERCECEFLDTAVATDSVIQDDKVAVLEMPKFAEKYLQPSAAALKESALIQSFYKGRPWQKGRELHDQYLQRKLERTLP